MFENIFGGRDMRYKFRYYNKGFKLLTIITIPIFNFVFPQLLSIAILRTISLIGLGKYFDDVNLLTLLYNAVRIFSALWVISYLFLPKGVFLYKKRLIIARHTVTLRNWKSIIFVKYDAIENVNINFKDLRFTKYHGSLLVPCGDEVCNIELTLKNGKKYFFSTEYQDDFCKHLKLLIDKYNEQKNSQ